MEHKYFEKMAPSAPMWSSEEERGGQVLPANRVGKILIREDTIVCAGCGRGHFSCVRVKEQWPVLCWGRQSDKKYYCLLSLLSATFLLSLLGIVIFCFTDTINDAIISKMVLRNGSLAFDAWQRPSVQPLMKVHIFNYTNWDRLEEDSDTNLEVMEMGPYVYSQQIERVGTQFEGDKLSYNEKNTYQYLANRSVGAQFDQLNVPNLPLIGVVAKAQSLNPWLKTAFFTGLAATYNKKAFIKLPVHRFLWGYSDDIYNIANLLNVKKDEFGLLTAKNRTSVDRLTINTGDVNRRKLNVIEKVNYDSILKYWDNPECNSIEATDGTIFPPALVQQKKTLYLYMTYLCRRLPLEFEKEVIADGVKLYRYRMPTNVFDYHDANPANQCYCETDTGSCPPRGVISVAACNMGVPLMVSFPHFYRGDPALREDITGLRPDSDRHESYVDIHPTLGIALQGKSSLQINIQVKRYNVPSLDLFKEGIILPIAWIEFEVDELPESVKAFIYHCTFSAAALQLGFTSLSIVALIVSSICLCLLVAQRRRRICATAVKIAVELNLQTKGNKQES